MRVVDSKWCQKIPSGSKTISLTMPHQCLQLKTDEAGVEVVPRLHCSLKEKHQTPNKIDVTSEKNCSGLNKSMYTIGRLNFEHHLCLNFGKKLFSVISPVSTLVNSGF
ncbi:hypothetical protein PoB_006691800 [Plakobranchus ocellatus]|uniref:Uncharacterized protein n=1 Tax=Plakobranchus ocellatus TaxID=259542 RepID=A0AAV4D8C0_9GAST|nr:hypothetical protein PoB_006691800 [Plakobranchus ocellatus]